MSELTRSHSILTNRESWLIIGSSIAGLNCFQFLVKRQKGDKVSFQGSGPQAEWQAAENNSPVFYLVFFPCVHSDALVIKHQKHAEKILNVHDKHVIYSGR